jgi:hypothetical protein
MVGRSLEKRTSTLGGIFGGIGEPGVAAVILAQC